MCEQDLKLSECHSNVNVILKHNAPMSQNPSKHHTAPVLSLGNQRIQGGRQRSGVGAPPPESKFFHFHAVLGKKFAK